jgi:hypothetical protein
VGYGLHKQVTCGAEFFNKVTLNVQLISDLPIVRDGVFLSPIYAGQNKQPFVITYTLNENENGLLLWVTGWQTEHLKHVIGQCLNEPLPTYCIIEFMLIEKSFDLSV